MDEKLSQLSPQQKRELLQKLLREKQIAESSEAAGSVREFPLSAGQRALWFGYRRDPRQTAYNVFLPSRFHDAMDLQRLERAVDRLVKRHDALRTTFAEHESDNHPVQRVASMGNHEFRVIDCESWSSEKLNRRVLAETQRPFDLTTGPLLRVACFRVRTDDIVIVATTHHIVVDFWSLVLMMSEIEFLYREQTLPRASSRYAEFVRTQDRTTNSPDGDRLRDYWRSKLAGVSPRLQLATDFPRPKQFTHRASVQPFRLESGVVEKIAALARRLNVTENAIVLALVQALLARFSSQDSFTVGTPFSGRLKQDFESTVGFFVNVLPIVADLSQSPTLSDLSRQVGRSMVDALANEALPFSDIVKTIKPARDNSHHPLFQVSCTFEKSHLTEEQGRAGFLLGDEGASRQFAGMRQEAYFVEHPTCHYDLEFVFEFT
ncbi:MAG: condensation domain-containing protein, partial [Planctomycetota bacterium]